MKINPMLGLLCVIMFLYILGATLSAPAPCPEDEYINGFNDGFHACADSMINFVNTH